MKNFLNLSQSAALTKNFKGNRISKSYALQNTPTRYCYCDGTKIYLTSGSWPRRFPTFTIGTNTANLIRTTWKGASPSSTLPGIGTGWPIVRTLKATVRLPDIERLWIRLGRREGSWTESFGEIQELVVCMHFPTSKEDCEPVAWDYQIANYRE